MSSILMIVPTLGTREDFLRHSLRTIAEQGRPDVRVVVVGPSASESTRAAADQYRFDFSPFDVPGLSRAVNHGWSTFGRDHDYLGWLGDDDGLAPGSLTTTADFLDNSRRASCVYGRVRVVWEDGSTQCLSRPGRFAGRWLPFGSDRVPQVGTLFRRQAVVQVGFLDADLRYCMDYDLLLALRRIGRLGYVPKELAFYRQHPAALSYNKGDGGAEVDRVRRRHWTLMQSRTSPVWQPLIKPVDFGYGVLLRHLPGPAAPSSVDRSSYLVP